MGQSRVSSGLLERLERWMMYSKVIGQRVGEGLKEHVCALLLEAERAPSEGMHRAGRGMVE